MPFLGLHRRRLLSLVFPKFLLKPMIALLFVKISLFICFLDCHHYSPEDVQHGTEEASRSQISIQLARSPDHEW
jgi:hypothetical protein